MSKWIRNGAHASWQQQTHPPSDAKNPRQHVFLSKIYNEHGSGKMNDIVSVLRGGPVGLLSRWPSADKRLCFLIDDVSLVGILDTSRLAVSPS